MTLRNICRNYFCVEGLENVFHPVEEINNPEVQTWISKSNHELNRYAQYIISLRIFEKEKPDYYTCQAIHECLNKCSVSIVFSLFNIFASITKTKASFFDQSIRDYFLERVKPSIEELYLLSFYWHEPVLSMNSLDYSADEFLKIYFSEVGLGFKVVNSSDGKYTPELEHSDIEETTNSIKFYTFHLLQLLSTIDLVVNLLNPGQVKTSSSQTSSFLQIENYHDLYSIYEDLIRKIESTT
jgi:hypothetical protein